MTGKKGRPGGNHGGGKKRRPNAVKHTVNIDNEIWKWLDSQGASKTIEEIARETMNEEKAYTEKTFSLVNPWSGAVGREMTWAEIKAWCSEHVAPNDRAAWLKEARKAAKANDCETLGAMIIGA